MIIRAFLTCLCSGMLLNSSAHTAQENPIKWSLAVRSTAYKAGDKFAWPPLDPKELASIMPRVEKDAPAEILLWQVRIDDSQKELTLEHFIRIKIYNERGRDQQSKVVLPYGNLPDKVTEISDLAARIIKPDGQIAELKDKDFFDNTIVKRGYRKLKAKTFVVPDATTGAIIEYHWREVWYSPSLYLGPPTGVGGITITFKTQLGESQFILQRDLPVQQVKYYLKPFSKDLIPSAKVFNAATQPALTKESDGFYSLTLNDLPGFQGENFMPPANQAKQWLAFRYTRKGKEFTAASMWLGIATSSQRSVQTLIKPNDALKQAAVTAIGNAIGEEEKLQRLYAFSRAKVRNLDDDTLPPPPNEKFKPNKSPADTLKQGAGTATDIDFLFAALANAAGFQVKYLLLPDRSDGFFDPDYPSRRGLPDQAFAIQLGGQWRFFKPGNAFAPFATLPWVNEGQLALLCDEKEPSWIAVPQMPPDKSHTNRVANLTLDEDGNLSGTVQLTYTGHRAADLRVYYAGLSPVESETNWAQDIKASLSAAEVTQFLMENLRDPEQPLKVSYKLHVPGYAQRTGKRILFPPALFQQGTAPYFTTSERRYDIYFAYPWAETDTVTIALPTGYVPDNPDAPAAVNGGALTQYQPRLSLSKDRRTLILSRKFFFGQGLSETGLLLYPANGYPELKRHFDLIQQRDNFSFVLKHTE